MATKDNIKHTALSVSEKMEIIKKVDAQTHVMHKKVAEQLSTPASTLNNMANKKNILQQCVTSQPGRKKLKSSKYEKTEPVLLEWLTLKRALNIPIQGPVLRQKAEEIAQKLNTEFTHSNGWLDRLRKRAGLSYRTMSGESKSVYEEDAGAWKMGVLPSLLSEYHPKDVFNGDECELFSNLLPDKTYAFKGESCHGGKRSKDRITVLVCTNMDGSEKMPLLVNGKSEKLRCFKHVKPMPCTYRHNSSAWITSALFMEFLTCLERRMAAKNRKTLLFVGHCAEHPKDTSKLRNVEVEFLPANTTKVLQPMDKEIIRSLKHKYHRHLVCKFLQIITTTKEC
jgi:hypothetical protein